MADLTSDEPPRLVASAVRHLGQIFTGHRHSDAIRNAAQITKQTPVIGTQGFVDAKRKFYTRREAVAIAKASGQIPEDSTITVLYSEDLW